MEPPHSPWGTEPRAAHGPTLRPRRGPLRGQGEAECRATGEPEVSGARRGPQQTDATSPPRPEVPERTIGRMSPDEFTLKSCWARARPGPPAPSLPRCLTCTRRSVRGPPLKQPVGGEGTPPPAGLRAGPSPGPRPAVPPGRALSGPAPPETRRVQKTDRPHPPGERPGQQDQRDCLLCRLLRETTENINTKSLENSQDSAAISLLPRGDNACPSIAGGDRRDRLTSPHRGRGAWGRGGRQCPDFPSGTQSPHGPHRCRPQGWGHAARRGSDWGRTWEVDRAWGRAALSPALSRVTGPRMVTWLGGAQVLVGRRHERGCGWAPDREQKWGPRDKPRTGHLLKGRDILFMLQRSPGGGGRP